MMLLKIALILFNLIAIMSSSMPSAESVEHIIPLQAHTTVSVFPENITADIGDNITLALIVKNVTQLYGFTIHLDWDPALLKLINHIVTIPVESYPNPIAPSPYPGILHQPYIAISDNLDETLGTYEIAYASLAPAASFNGSGTAFILTFSVLKQGACYFNLTTVDLADNIGQPISHIIQNGLLRTPNSPVAHFTSQQETNVNTSVLFNASKSYHPDAPTRWITNYTWNFDDGNTTSTSTSETTHTYIESGTYKALLTVTDNEGNIDNETREIWVPYRDVAIEEVEIVPPLMLLVGSNSTVKVTISNLGEKQESFVISVYRNETVIDWGNISATQWILLNQCNETIVVGSPPTTWSSAWNTTGVLGDYFLMANTSISFDANLTNNILVSTVSVSIQVSFSPVAFFSFSPNMPIVGESVTFDASGSIIPGGGSIRSYNWDFGDGTQKNTTTPLTTKTYDAPGIYNVTLTVTESKENLTHSVTKYIEITPYYPLDIEVDVGTIHFAGETASFSILVSRSGVRIPISKSSLQVFLYFGDEIIALQVDPAASMVQLDTGLFNMSYKIPLTAPDGTYTLLVEASYSVHDGGAVLRGTTLKSFMISSTLKGWDALLTSISNNTATILVPGMTEIKLNLSSINATLIDIQGSTAILNSTFGILETKLNVINVTLANLIVDSKGEILVQIESDVGSITASIDGWENTISWIQTTVTLGLMVSSAFSAIALIAAALAILGLRRIRE